MILLISSKKVYAVARLLQEAKKMGMAMKVMGVQDLLNANFKISPKKFSCLYIRQPYLAGSAEYLPQVINLAKVFKAAGKKVVDAVIAEGELGEGKWYDYQQLAQAGLPIPRTELFKNSPLFDDRQKVVRKVIKWIYGFKSRGVFFISSAHELQKIPKHIPKEELLVQEFIPAKYEYKIITIGYKALPIVLRFQISPKTHRPDFKKFKAIHINKNSKAHNPKIWKIVEVAGAASKLLKRELAKVDILEKDDQLYILEVNRWPGFKSFEELTSYNVAGEFLNYLSLPKNLK